MLEMQRSSREKNREGVANLHTRLPSSCMSDEENVMTKPDDNVLLVLGVTGNDSKTTEAQTDQ